MAKITQKQLIEQIKILKEINPRKEWAVLFKSTLLENKVSGRMADSVATQKTGFMDILLLAFTPRKLAYSFAVGLFLIVGFFGFAVNTVPGDLLFPIKKIAEQSQAALTGQTGLRSSVAILNSRINELAQVAKEGRIENIPSAISEINANALELAKNLKDNPGQDQQTIKEIAISLKTLANVPGTDLSENPDVRDLYQTIVQEQINDLHKITLTDEQKVALYEVEDLYNQGKYTDALEKILLINN